MELSGEEKKLQALFSELRVADEVEAPHFGATWNAQVAPQRVRVFNPAFVAVALLLVFGVVAFAVWSRYSRTTSATPPEAVVNVLLPSPPSTPGPASTNASTSQETRPNVRRTVARRNNAAARHQAMLAAANQKLQKDAKSIANWTSPTSALLESPSDEIFSSIPELNQSATQLKSFLPSRPN